jgi:hypothetical protein
MSLRRTADEPSGLPAVRRTALYSAIESGLRPPEVTIATSARGSGWPARALGAALTLATLMPVAQAATIQVTTTDFGIAVDAECSLLEAVENANSASDTTGGECVAGEAGLDTIEFDAALSGSTITFSEPIDVDEELAITGLGQDNLAFEQSFDGDYSMIEAGAPLTLEGVTMRGGDAYYGGAISASDDLTISDSRFVYNSSRNGGGAIHGLFTGKYLEEGSNPDAAWRLENVSFERNYGNNGGGGAVLMRLGNYAGPAAPSLEVIDSEFTYNVAGAGGALLVALGEYDGPEAPIAASVSIEGTTFRYNRAYDGGGGGALLAVAEVQVETSDFDSNEASYANGGGLMIYGGDEEAPSTVTISDSSFQNNGAEQGGGLGVYRATVTLTDTLIRRNVAFGEFEDRTSPRGGAPSCGGQAYGYGGGVLFGGFGSSTLSGSGVTISENCASATGGGLFSVMRGDEVLGDAAISLVDSEISGNRSSGPGGGAFVVGLNYADLTIERTTIAGNRSIYGTGGGVQFLSAGDEDQFRLVDSTISGNEAIGGGGVMLLGTPYSDDFDASILNSTFDGNRASGSVLPRAKGINLDGRGGGIAAENIDALTLDFVTMSGNDAAVEGGGLRPSSNGTTTLRNSLLADNTASGSGPEVAGVIAADFSLFEDPSGATINGGNNLTGVDALLGPLQDNGGPTLTRLPDIASPAVNAGDPAFAAPPDFDQRGAGFPRNVAGGVDMGAVERGQPTIIAIDIAPDPFAEGGNATLTVTLDQTAGADVVADVVFSGEALLNTDFTSEDDDIAPGVQVRVPNGSDVGTVVLQAGADAIDELDETFTATITQATGAAVAGGSINDTATITDGNATPSLSINDVIVPESGGSANFTVTLSGASSQTVTVQYTSANGSAVAPGDYASSAGTLTFTPGTLTQPIAVTVVADAVSEPDETFDVALSAPANAVIDGVNGTGTATITDSNGTPVVNLAVAPNSITEGGGAATVTLTLSGASSQDVLVTLTFSGSATFGSDYTVPDADPGTPGVQVLIPAGQTSVSIPITPLADASNEGNETIVVDLSNAPGVVIGQSSQGSAVIQGGVTAPVAPQPALIPTLSEWMLMLLGLLLPATVVARLRRDQVRAGRRSR